MVRPMQQCMYVYPPTTVNQSPFKLSKMLTRRSSQSLSSLGGGIGSRAATTLRTRRVEAAHWKNANFLSFACSVDNGNVRRSYYSMSNKEDNRSNNDIVKFNPVVNGIRKPWGMVLLPHSSFSTAAKLPGVNTHAILQSTPLFLGPIRTFSNSSDEEFIHGKPTLKYATKLRKTWASMSNEQILHFAHFEVPEACRECVIRDIMVVDQIDYDEAMKVFDRIAASNREGMPLYAFPFQAGFAAAFLGGWVSIPLVFDEATMTWFNHHFVTAELPPAEDLETWLEVGAASWGWMEPVLGQISFFLLCMQFARAQLQNLGIRPYFNWQREKRADRLVQMYPRYDPEFLRAYSKCDRLASPHQFEK